jgi:hypothetical protein
MASRYLMQIVDRKTGDVVQFEPGQAAELEFVEDCVAKVVRLGVGLGRTSTQVSVAIRQGIEEAIHGLKRRVRP